MSSGHSDGTTRAVWRHAMLFLFFYIMLEYVATLFASALGGHVDWKLSPEAESTKRWVLNGWNINFGWTIPLTTCNALFWGKKEADKYREGKSCTVVTVEESQNLDQMVKALEVDNVRHAEGDYFVRAWIECQFTGLWPHGSRLRLYCQVCTALHTESTKWFGRSQKCISDGFHTPSDFSLSLYMAHVLFDWMHSFIIKSNLQAFPLQVQRDTVKSTSCAHNAARRRKYAESGSTSASVLSERIVMLCILAHTGGHLINISFWNIIPFRGVICNS